MARDRAGSGHALPRRSARELLDAGANLIIVPSASPYQQDKLALRVSLCSDLAKQGGVPVAYCNMAGANDSLVFDGRSFLVDSGPGGPGAVSVATLRRYRRQIDTSRSGRPLPTPASAARQLPERWDEVERALSKVSGATCASAASGKPIWDFPAA